MDSEISKSDTAKIIGTVFAPMIAQGVVVRRPRPVAIAARLDADRHAGALLRRLRDKYGPAPLRVRLANRNFFLPLTADDVQQVLDHAPEPYTPASHDKRGALGHFQPNGVLISDEPLRTPRREFNESVLETGERVHHLAATWADKIGDEAAGLLTSGAVDGVLDWTRFNRAWWRVVRRVTLGDSARDDDRVTDDLARLRRAANWAYARPVNRPLRSALHRQLHRYVQLAAPDSLAGMVASMDARADVDPVGQIPHWLFAFDAAGIATYRALVLLATHPDQRANARAEVSSGATGGELPYLSACVLEAVRLWPTTMVVLRDVTTDTTLDGVALREGDSVAIIPTLFHRDPALPHANRFAPEIWLGETRPELAGLIPFSDGPARCPGRNVVTYVTSTLLAQLLADHEYVQVSGQRLDPTRPLPPTLDHFRLRLRFRS